ncbi:heme exporter protein CcmD [Colwellia sp. D2M02]|uniref:Heme exporter protein D n=1 Tax=Colwellia asteriadis TaxID=517723 RepID=A0ABN1L576_9GAMM|nr:heme exporter protein CcmD [Colwellia sp. D2M02]MBU2894287.1 heme exporter protein CcmD [Colwellia sp. D2M02]
MQFTHFSDFISMGGYGFYVWLSFGATALLLTLLVIDSKAGHKRIINHIAQHKRREDKLRKSREQRKKAAKTDDSAAG